MFWAKYKVDSLWWAGPVADTSKTQQAPKLYHDYTTGGKCFVWTDPLKEKNTVGLRVKEMLHCVLLR